MSLFRAFVLTTMGSLTHPVVFLVRKPKEDDGFDQEKLRELKEPTGLDVGTLTDVDLEVLDDVEALTARIKKLRKARRPQNR